MTQTAPLNVHGVEIFDDFIRWKGVRYYPEPYASPPLGCICHPGSNKECETVLCPRKKWLSG